MTKDAPARTHLLRDVAQRGAARAREHGEQHQLVERGLVFEARRKIDDVDLVHLGGDKRGRAAARRALAKAIPVVVMCHAGLPRAHGRDHVFARVVAARKHVDPVSEDAARAVVLLSVHHPACAIT